MTITIDSLPDEIAEWLRAHAADRKASVEDEARLQLESAVRRQQALRLDLDRIAQIRARIGSKPLTDIEITRAKNWGRA